MAAAFFHFAKRYVHVQILMCCFLLYVIIVQTVRFQVVGEMAPVVFIHNRKKMSETIFEDCVNFGCGNQIFVEIGLF